MSFSQRAPGRCRNEDRCRKYQRGECRFVHPDQPEWETAKPFVSFDDHGPGRGRGRGDGHTDGGSRYGGGRSGGHWNESHSNGGGGGRYNSYGQQNNNWGGSTSQPSSSAWDDHDKGATNANSWNNATFTESNPAPAANSSNSTSAWGNTIAAPEASGASAKKENSAWGSWDKQRPQSPTDGWAKSTGGSSWDTWGGASPVGGNGWGAGSQVSGGGWGSTTDDGGWGSNTANDNSAGGWGESNAGGLPSSGSTTNAGTQNNGWPTAKNVNDADVKGKGKMRAEGGGGWPASSKDDHSRRRASNDFHPPTSDNGWGSQRRPSQTSPPSSRRASGPQTSSSWTNHTGGTHGQGWGSGTGNDGWGQTETVGWDTATVQQELPPAPTIEPPAPPVQPPQPRSSFASQILDALVRSEDLRSAETRLERTKRMEASPRYEKRSPAMAAKLNSDLHDANEHLTRKSDELRSRLRRLAKLPGAEKVFAEIDSEIDLEWLTEGDLQKWTDVAEPAVRAYLSAKDAGMKQKVKTEGFDARPDWVKELPAFKNIKPLSAEQAKGIAGDDKLLRAVIQTFGTDSPRLRQAVSVARAQADMRNYGPQLDAIEREGDRKQARIAELRRSLQEMKERDARRAEQEASEPTTAECIKQWKLQLAANKIVYDRQTKEFEKYHAAYPKLIQQLDNLPPVDDVEAIAASLRPAMIESIQRLAGPLVDKIVADARQVAADQAREQARVVIEQFQPLLTLMEYAKMKERNGMEAAEKVQTLEQERVEYETQRPALENKTLESSVGPLNGPERESASGHVPERKERSPTAQHEAPSAVVQPQNPAVQQREELQLANRWAVTRETQSPSTTLDEDEVDQLIDTPGFSRSTSYESESDIRL
ncbi:unnamed protein product [Peniophora sp. CBMAI 1063]|nr:unnamed protein product [Peniophora sp. CBMAI 1063]